MPGSKRRIKAWPSAWRRTATPPTRRRRPATGNDAVVELGAFRRLHDALAVVALEAVADVKRDTLVKEYSLLGDDGRQPAQRRLLDSSDIYAADAYTAARDVVEAARQPRRRALA